MLTAKEARAMLTVDTNKYYNDVLKYVLNEVRLRAETNHCDYLHKREFSDTELVYKLEESLRKLGYSVITWSCGVEYCYKIMIKW